MDREWVGRWIGTGFTHIGKAPSKPAPFFRKVFQYDGKAKKAVVFFCGLGWSELYLNGKKVGDSVLTPTVTMFDRRVRYVRYDVTMLLKKGENVFGVILGNGWYDCSTEEVWNFCYASWLDYPKFLLDFASDGKIILSSDESWKCLKEDGPILFNELRNGEFYDARKEMPHWSEKGFDDSAWGAAEIVPGPGGILTEQQMPPCKVMRRIPAQKVAKTYDDQKLYDLGQNITGWAHIKVKGEAGAEITLRYGEQISDYKDQLLQDNIKPYVKSGEFQMDKYTLSGHGTEEWEPRFTYHGFRYVEIRITGKAEIIDFEGCLVHTAFDSLTDFKSSDPVLNKLHECTIWSFIDNFTGIPTDCPHREKNGWTGDALLAAETGLFHFDMESSYHDWLQSVADAQRPSGQLPGIVPTAAGWGFNWGSGPAWDSAFILIPWYVYLYTGKTQIIEENYEGMKQYISYLHSLSTSNNLVKFGLGDWCHVDTTRICDTSITSTGYYYADTIVMAKCAKLLGKKDDAKKFSMLAKEIAKSFNQTFYNGDGTYGKEEMTALACALYHGLCPAKETAKTASKLDELVRNNRYKADFGILGAKYIPRVLADYGYAETAYRLITQPAFPGWVDWLNHGATTLWETWSGNASQNHIMFGDIAAWMMQYLAGIVPDEKHPGFSSLTIRPFIPAELNSLKVSYCIPAGKISIDWKKQKTELNLTLSIPSNVPCKVYLPDGSVCNQSVPTQKYCIKGV